MKIVISNHAHNRFFQRVERNEKFQSGNKKIISLFNSAKLLSDEEIKSSKNLFKKKLFRKSNENSLFYVNEESKILFIAVEKKKEIIVITCLKY